MLAADKLQLQSSLKQQATALKEKEFTLHHSNLMTVGTQAAVLAGLDVTMFIEFNPPPNSEWDPEMIGRTLKFLYYITITCAFCANMLVVSQTTVLSVLGAGMALRGPDGSMMTATDGLYEERTSVFVVFGAGLACTLGSVVLCVWVMLSWEAALICMLITLITCRKVYQNYERVRKRFDFDESETVDFRDIFEGAANIHTYSHKVSIGRSNHHHHKKNTPKSRRNKRRSHSPQYDSNSPSSDGDEEMELMVPKSINARSRGVQRRTGPGACSSVNSYESAEHSDMFHIQTV